MDDVCMLCGQPALIKVIHMPEGEEVTWQPLCVEHGAEFATDVLLPLVTESNEVTQ